MSVDIVGLLIGERSTKHLLHRSVILLRSADAERVRVFKADYPAAIGIAELLRALPRLRLGRPVVIRQQGGA